ncbi:MAG: aspartate kinase [Desulfarculus sp.]|nr:aspartate kinase [Desulfarculus sp.]
MIVMKFGGSSVANRQQIAKVMEIVQSRLPRRPIVVSSAHKGMTDNLINAAKAAANRQFSLPDVIDFQSEIAQELGCPPEILSGLYQDLSDLLRGIGLVRELSPRSLDHIASFGERMAVRCIADFFTRQGLKSQAYDVWDLGFITDANFGCARPLADYDQRMRQAFAELVPPDVVPIVTGFVGQTEQGDITTVGRNGSDLTATLVGAALGAEEVEIWTDTDGVMTADPSVVPGARNIPLMRFDEAAELAHFGGRVLHPSTLLPAMERGIPVRVLNTNHPGHPGTVIDRQGEAEPQSVTSIAYKENQVVLTISSTGMLQQAGFLAKVFQVLARHDVVVDMISTSEISVSLTSDRLDLVKRAIPDLEEFGECQVRAGKTVLVVVGRNLAQRGGQGAEILKAMAQAGARVDMVSLGMGSINFSMVVDDADIPKAVPILHQVLFEQE